MTTYQHPKTGQRQHLYAHSIRDGAEPIESAIALYPARTPRVVYSDPPWNPGNETFFRTQAGLDPAASFSDFVRSWCHVAFNVCAPRCVFVEQSAIAKHRDAFIDIANGESFACARLCLRLSLKAQYEIIYGNPKRPNTLLYYGQTALDVDPTGMSSDKLVELCIGAVADKKYDSTDLASTVVIDPCTGLGTTSRAAHRLGLDFIGTELVPERMERTAAWLLKKGYVKQ